MNVDAALRTSALAEEFRSSPDQVLGTGRHRRVSARQVNRSGCFLLEFQGVIQIYGYHAGDKLVVAVWSFAQDFEEQVHLRGRLDGQ